MNPFDYLNSINHTKQDIMDDDNAERGYNSFLINRSLSYFYDTVGIANLMNRYHHLDNKLQYHFLINIIRKRKRFSKWMKPETESDIEVVKQYYGYSNDKAKNVLPLLSPEQITIIRQKVKRGGRTNS
jgi:hypothetical protein|tara:strand:- start:327 stop:710 length:384 start_codon:yes stop_codon:yes gene_type:complete